MTDEIKPTRSFGEFRRFYRDAIGDSGNIAAAATSGHPTIISPERLHEVLFFLSGIVKNVREGKPKGRQRGARAEKALRMALDGVLPPDSTERLLRSHLPGMRVAVEAFGRPPKQEKLREIDSDWWRTLLRSYWWPSSIIESYGVEMFWHPSVLGMIWVLFSVARTASTGFVATPSENYPPDVLARFRKLALIGRQPRQISPETGLPEGFFLEIDFEGTDGGSEKIPYFPIFADSEPHPHREEAEQEVDRLMKALTIESPPKVAHRSNLDVRRAIAYRYFRDDCRFSAGEAHLKILEDEGIDTSSIGKHAQDPLIRNLKQSIHRGEQRLKRARKS